MCENNCLLQISKMAPVKCMTGTSCGQCTCARIRISVANTHYWRVHAERGHGPDRLSLLVQTGRRIRISVTNTYYNEILIASLTLTLKSEVSLWSLTLSKILACPSTGDGRMDLICHSTLDGSVTTIKSDQTNPNVYPAGTWTGRSTDLPNNVEFCKAWHF